MVELGFSLKGVVSLCICSLIYQNALILSFCKASCPTPLDPVGGWATNNTSCLLQIIAADNIAQIPLPSNLGKTAPRLQFSMHCLSSIPPISWNADSTKQIYSLSGVESCGRVCCCGVMGAGGGPCVVGEGRSAQRRVSSYCFTSSLGFHKCHNCLLLGLVGSCVCERGRIGTLCAAWKS